jgi:hypothetical protein
MSTVQRLSWLTLAVAAAACSERQDPFAPVPADGASLPQAAKSAAVADISGTWLWSEEVIFSVAAPLTGVFFGIQPEGPITHFTCHETGTMTLIQAGASFSGTASQLSECRTRGGQVFSPPVFPPTLDVADGTIEGRSVHLLFGAGDINCPCRATISMEGGQAVRLTGSGRCIEPGHPLSGIPLDPPDQAGASPTVNWEAVRP